MEPGHREIYLAMKDEYQSRIYSENALRDCIRELNDRIAALDARMQNTLRVTPIPDSIIAGPASIDIHGR